ncbi:MAG: ribbon-helix-helix protein, CopG family [Candidatus Aenigmarchaeota archaeon]|nr:ribbon-helix-helix protein, CopG family [Candidatus Aenigmarchaeota archaeon]
MKDKIAISLHKETLEKIDKKIDGTNIRSRSQAIEILIKKGLALSTVNTAVLLLSKMHANIPAKPFKSSSVLDQQTEFFRKNNITNIYAIVQGGLETDKVTVIKTNEKTNGDALRQAKGVIKDNFVVMSGDIYTNFDLAGMIGKHMTSGKMATIGLMSSPTPGKYGTAVMEGDMVVSFAEKPKKPESHITNAGIYIFSPEIFSILKGSIEKNVLPELARKKQLVGYFTTGEYVHFGEMQ